jgi:hypothetical protein
MAPIAKAITETLRIDTIVYRSNRSGEGDQRHFFARTPRPLYNMQLHTPNRNRVAFQPQTAT